MFKESVTGQILPLPFPKKIADQWRLVPKIIGGAARKLAVKLSWLKYQVCGHNVAGSMPTDITSSCLWETP